MTQYRIVDKLGNGWEGLIFDSKEDVRQRLITDFWYDQETPEELRKLTLEEICEGADLEVVKA